MIDIKGGLASMVYNVFDKRSAGNELNMHPNNERFLDLTTQKLAEELRKPIIRKFTKITVYPGFKNNVWLLIQLICN